METDEVRERLVMARTSLNSVYEILDQVRNDTPLHSQPFKVGIRFIISGIVFARDNIQVLIDMLIRQKES